MPMLGPDVRKQPDRRFLADRLDQAASRTGIIGFLGMMAVVRGQDAADAGIVSDSLLVICSLPSSRLNPPRIIRRANDRIMIE